MKQNRIEKYLGAIEEAFKNRIGEEEFWPLKPVQMTAYFEDSLAVDIFKRINIFREQGRNLRKMGKLFFTPTLLRNFLLNFASTGLKVAHTTGWFKTSFREREDFFNYLFDVLEEMVSSDIFVKDKQQIIFSQKEINEIAWESFLKLNKQASGIIKRFKLALFGLSWALFFDTFYANGVNNHGPYPVPIKKFGKGATLAINDYFNLRPVEIWKDVSKMPFEKVRIYNIYKNIDWRINFFSREDPTIDIGASLSSVLIEIDGKKFKNLVKLEKLTNDIFEITEKQTNFVNGLKPLEQVKKAAEISYYGLRNIFLYFGEDWKPPWQINEVIKKFGEEFIRKFGKVPPKITKLEIRKKFNPRNNFF